MSKRAVKRASKSRRDLSKKKVTLKDLQAIRGGDSAKKVDQYPKPAPPPPPPEPSPFRTWFCC